MPIYVGDTTGGRNATTLASTGSTWFGNSSDDLHNFQGTLYLTGAAVFNTEGASTGDFRVESDGEDEAIFLDASSNTLYVNKGATSFTTVIKNNNEEAIRVGAGGIIFNQYGHASNDFRVESDNNEYMFFVDSSTDMIGIGTSSPAAYLDIKNTTDDGSTNRTMLQLHNYRADDADANDWGPISIDFKVENVSGGAKSGTARIAAVSAPVGTDHSVPAGERSSGLIFSTMNDETLAEAMRINATGDVGIGTTSPNCMLHVAGAFAAAGPSETFQTFANGDYTPSLANGNLFKTYDGDSQGATSLDDGVAGQTVTIISTNAFTYMASGGNLKAGTTNITTAAGDVTTWVYDGTYWYLMNFMDQSSDLSGGH